MGGCCCCPRQTDEAGENDPLLGRNSDTSSADKSSSSGTGGEHTASYKDRAPSNIRDIPNEDCADINDMFKESREMYDDCFDRYRSCHKALRRFKKAFLPDWNTIAMDECMRQLRARCVEGQLSITRRRNLIQLAYAEAQVQPGTMRPAERPKGTKVKTMHILQSFNELTGEMKGLLDKGPRYCQDLQDVLGRERTTITRVSKGDQPDPRLRQQIQIVHGNFREVRQLQKGLEACLKDMRLKFEAIVQAADTQILTSPGL